VGICVCVYKIEKLRTLSAPSEIASLREAISSSAAFESIITRKHLSMHLASHSSSVITIIYSPLWLMQLKKCCFLKVDCSGERLRVLQEI
jgi:hypothetical protein